MIILHESLESCQIHRDRKYHSGCQGLGQGRINGSYCLMAIEFQFFKMKKTRDWLQNNVDILTPLNCTLENS